MGNKGNIVLKKVKSISLRTLGTIALPLVVFLAMLIACAANGITSSFLTANTVDRVLKGTCYAALVAMALSTQILNGRFDFSGGITIMLSAYVAGHIAEPTGSLFLYVILCILFGLGISLITATAYRFLKLPIIICSIALTLVYESFPRFLFQGNGLQLFSKPEFNIISELPLAAVMLLAGVLIYFYFKDLSPFGTKAKLLSSNQQTSVNIGINENKNLYVTYIVSGLLFGLAAALYGGSNWIQPGEIGNLSTTSVAFSNIVPVYIGMFIGFLSFGWIGVLAGALTIQIINVGLNIILGGETTGYFNIVFGVFMILFWTLSAELGNIKKLADNIKAKFSRNKTVES